MKLRSVYCPHTILYSRLVNIMQEKSDSRGHAYLENKTIVQVSQKLRVLETEHACNKYLFSQQIRLNWFDNI